MSNHKKGSNLIVIIFVILILLPSIFLVPITNFITNSEGVDILKFPIFIKISAFIGSFSTIFGLFMIYRQIEKDKKISASKFLVELNDSISSFDSTKNIYKKLLNLENKKYTKSIYKKAFSSDEDNYDMVEYANFFQNIEFLLRKNILNIEEIDNMFSKRFFIFVNNPYIQEIKIIKYDYAWVDIYRLSRSLIEYKNDNDIKIPYNKYSISKLSSYDKYSSGYYSYKSLKNNIFFIFIFSSTLFLVLLFFILLYFGYQINNISSIVSTCGTVIGAFSIVFQLNAENNLNKARFLFDLNKSFNSKKNYKDIYIKASINYYHNLLFINKNDFIKNINNDELFNYLTFFESINVMLENHALKIQDIYLLFGYKFFFVVNNPYVQKKILLKNNIFFKNIYRLNRKMILYCKLNKLSIDYDEYSLEKIDKDYYKLSK